jgi:hypothetical protein
LRGEQAGTPLAEMIHLDGIILTDVANAKFPPARL